MGQINKIPLGYLNMLGSQTGGKNPFDASEIVNPVIGMNQFYHAQGMSVSTDSVAYTNPGDNVVRSVPDNEAWFLYAWGFSAIAGAGADELAMMLQVSHLPRSSTPTLGGIIASVDQPFTVNAANQIIAGSFVFPVPIPLVAGARLTSTVTAKTNNNTATVNYTYAKFTA